jgi:hypothetical protein
VATTVPSDRHASCFPVLDRELLGFPVPFLQRMHGESIVSGKAFLRTYCPGARREQLSSTTLLLMALPGSPHR